MKYIKTAFNAALLLLILISFSPAAVKAQGQTDDRMQQIESRLKTLAVTVPGLNQKVQLAMSGASGQEFLRALAQSNNLNINIDPQVNFKIYNNFTNETALNVLLFISKEYNLDINLIGSIMSVTNVPAAKVIPQPRDIRVTYTAANDNLGFELNNDSLSLVARKISQLSQKNVVVPVSLLSKKVTAFIASAPFEIALEKMAYANELKFTKTSDGVYIFQALKEGEELYINGDNATAVKKTPRPAAQGGGDGNNYTITSKKDAAGNKLLSVDAINAPVLDLIRTASAELDVNYFLYDGKGAVSSTSQQTSNNPNDRRTATPSRSSGGVVNNKVTTHLTNISFDNFLSALLQGTDYTFRKEGSIYLIGDRSLEGLRAIKLIQLQHRSLDTVQMMIPQIWKNDVEITEFREQNTLLLAGSAPGIAEIENYIKQIDRVVPMVLIEVTLVDIRKGKVIKTGISAGVSDSVKTGGTILPGLDYTFGANSINDFLSKLGRNNSVNLGKVTPNFYVRLSALENNSNVEIRSVPKLSTLNGHTANLSIGSSRFYSQRTQNVIPSLNAQTVVTEQFTEVNANLEINIKPIVAGDDQVTLNIMVNISDFIGNPPENAPPPKSNSKFTSTIRARNEDMIVLGGLERTENTESASGIPLLSRIPILKWLFSSREKANNKVVTLVFIKPTIIY